MRSTALPRRCIAGNRRRCRRRLQCRILAQRPTQLGRCKVWPILDVRWWFCPALCGLGSANMSGTRRLTHPEIQRNRKLWMVTGLACSYLEKFLHFFYDQLLNFLGENFRASFNELVVDVLKTLQARLFLSVGDLTEKTSCGSQWIVLKIQKLMLEELSKRCLKNFLTFESAWSDRLTCWTSVGSAALSNWAKMSLIFGVFSLVSLQNVGSSLMARRRICN